MAEKANDLINNLGPEGKLVGLTVKVAPQMRANLYHLRKRTSKGISELVNRALESFFEGYEIPEGEEIADQEIDENGD